MSEDPQPADITRMWLLWPAVLLSPIVLLFATYGKFELGMRIWICLVIVAIAAKINWRLNEEGWFWVVIIMAIPAQIPFIMFVPWNNKHLSGTGLLPFGVLDYGLIYGALKLGELLTKRNDRDTSTS